MLNFSTDKLSEASFAFLLNIPTLLLMAFVLIFPLGYALYLSFLKVNAMTLATGNAPFLGLRNYFTVISSEYFVTSLIQTCIFASISVSLMLISGLLIGLVLKRDYVFLSSITKGLVLLPWAVPPAANGLLWRFLFNPSYGYLNQILLKLGLISERIAWLSDPDTALYAVIVPYVWRTMPFSALILYAALQGIPKRLYESAKIDGAGPLGQFFHVTLPLLKPAIFVILVLRTAFAFMVFDEVYTMTQGGPGNSTWLVAWYTYTRTFRDMEFGIGAASAWIITVCIAFLVFLYVRFLYTKVEY